MFNDSYSDVLSHFRSPFENHSSGNLSNISSESARKLSVNKNYKPLSNSMIDRLTTGESIIQRINTTIPFEGTKQLPELKGIKNGEKLTAILEDGDWLAKLRRTAQLANKYGAAYLILDINDGRDVNLPVNYTRKSEILGSYILTHEECQPLFPSEVTYDLPELYSVKRKGEFFDIHESRVLAFYGVEKTGDELRLANGKHEPLWYGCFSKLLSYLESNSAALNMLKDASVGIYKLKGLHDKLAEAAACPEGDQAATQELYKRLSLLVDSVTIINKLIIDLENEEYEYVERDYTGVTTILSDLRRTFIEYAPLPASILFQSVESSGMFSDSSGSDRELLAMSVLAWQISQLTPNLKKILKVYDRSTSSVSIEYYSSVHYTMKEQASILFDVTKSLVALTSAKIITPQMAARRLDSRKLKVAVDLSEDEIKQIPNEFEGNTQMDNPAGVRQSDNNPTAEAQSN